MGHLRRSLALAAALAKKADITLVTRDGSNLKPWAAGFRIYVLSPGSMSSELKQLQVLLHRQAAQLLIVDHYEYRSKELRQLRREFDGTILTFDDIPRERDYPVDGIINHNIYGPQLDYPSRKGQALFRGARYTLISSDVAHARRSKTIFDRPRLFISVGGTASPAALRPFLAGFRQFQKRFPKASARIAGGLRLKRKTKGVLPGMKWVRPDTVAPAMGRSNLALSASGVTTYELAYLGIPALLFVAADNQKRIARAMSRAGCGRHGGRLQDAKALQIARSLSNLWNNARKLKQMSQCGRRLIDGKGPERLAREISKRYL